jgi:hypothetical protein
VASNEYHFTTNWRLDATLEEIAAVLSDPTDLPRWWPAVYLEVRELERGDERGVGKVVDLYTKGWLPYTLRWQFRVSAIEPGRSVTLEAWGDFVGRGVWSFAQEGQAALVTYDWRVRADKPLLRRFSALLKPLFSANHEWAMRQGERSLRLELARRRAGTAEERAAIPPPPAGTGTSRTPLLVTLLALAVLYAVLRALRSRAAL